jgi:hypothetical protein
VLLDGIGRDVQFLDDLPGGMAPDDQRDHPGLRSGEPVRAEQQRAELRRGGGLDDDTDLRRRPATQPGRVLTVRPDGGTPKISPCCVPLAVKFSTTRSPSSTLKPMSLCQSGNAARNAAAAARMPSRLAGKPIASPQCASAAPRRAHSGEVAPGATRELAGTRFGVRSW